MSVWPGSTSKLTRSRYPSCVFAYSSAVGTSSNGSSAAAAAANSSNLRCRPEHQPHPRDVCAGACLSDGWLPRASRSCAMSSSVPALDGAQRIMTNAEQSRRGAGVGVNLGDRCRRLTSGSVVDRWVVAGHDAPSAHSSTHAALRCGRGDAAVGQVHEQVADDIAVVAEHDVVVDQLVEELGRAGVGAPSANAPV